jgi:hypothetical protein
MSGREPVIRDVVKAGQRLTMGWRAELVMILAGAAFGLTLGILIHLGSPEYTMGKVWKAVGSGVVLLAASRAIVLLGLWAYPRGLRR